MFCMLYSLVAKTDGLAPRLHWLSGTASVPTTLFFDCQSDLV